MKNPHSPSRRRFIKAGIGLGAIATLGINGRAWSSTASDYKALVCIYLAGGHDGNNLLIPMDSDRYGDYAAARGALAIAKSKLTQTEISDTTPAGNCALHYGLSKIHGRYMAGQTALVLNMGNLLRPLTRDEFLAGAPAPSNLFSHSDQMVQAQMGVARGDSTGWGGRLLDCVAAGNTALGGISVAQPAAFLSSLTDAGNVIVPGGNLELTAMRLWPTAAAQARRQAVLDTLTDDGGSPLRAAANTRFAKGMQLSADLAASYPSDFEQLGLKFPPTSIGGQMAEIARLIHLRRHQGPGRQVFFATLGGFDTHAGQDYMLWNQFMELSAAMDAFYIATRKMSLDQQVTTFTLSEFGRTLQSNGGGSDHGWGNHQIVMGGAVRGGIYGELPDFRLGNQGGQDDANDRGVWIPRFSTEQYAATLGRWFGASDAQLNWAFTSLAEFNSADLGFMA